jgi:hypothetical protein
MKLQNNNFLKLILLLLVVQNVISLQAQIRIGGNIAPNPNAILDLNANDTAIGSKGLMLPKVALISTTNASPFSKHEKGMFVYNTSTVNNVFPGVYHNDGKKWIQTHSGDNNFHSKKSNMVHLYIPIDETIGTQSVIYRGTTPCLSLDLKTLNIKPIFSDYIMSQTLFTVTSLAKTDPTGTFVKWSVRIVNSNIDPAKDCVLEQVVISYMCEDGCSEIHEPKPVGSIETYILVGQ